MTQPTNDLLTELRTAMEARRVAEELVGELRREVVARDVPRPWVFSHGGVAGWVKDQPARPSFITVESTRAEVDRKLRAAVRASTFDTSERPIDVHATAYCNETGESVSGVWVHLEQTVPDCVRPEGHDWSVVCLDDRSPEGHPSGRLLTEGCPHCDGQRKTLWIHADHEHTVVSYEAPHHYPEGAMRRALKAAV
jgi:hypothetical protein